MGCFVYYPLFIISIVDLFFLLFSFQLFVLEYPEFFFTSSNFFLLCMIKDMRNIIFQYSNRIFVTIQTIQIFKNGNFSSKQCLFRYQIEDRSVLNFVHVFYAFFIFSFKNSKKRNPLVYMEASLSNAPSTSAKSALFPVVFFRFFSYTKENIVFFISLSVCSSLYSRTLSWLPAKVCIRPTVFFSVVLDSSV